MVRLEKLDPSSQTLLGNMPCPEFETRPWVAGPPLQKRRVAIIPTAGLHRAGDRPFTIPAGTVAKLQGDYRVIPGNRTAADLVMSHISTNFDRTGFQQDWNVAFPLDRLCELATAGVIGSVADFHYSFMGATPPQEMESSARRLAALFKQDKVDAVLLVPI